jgi:hypothetical protein
VFICVKITSTAGELWTDDHFEMTAVELKGRDPKFTWEIVAPNKDMRVIERLADRNEYIGNSTIPVSFQ